MFALERHQIFEIHFYWYNAYAFLLIYIRDIMVIFDVWGVIFDQLLNSLVQKSALSGFKGLKMNLIVLNLFFERHRVPLMNAPPLRNVSMRKLHH